jgi:hypothetical protein
MQICINDRVDSSDKETNSMKQDIVNTNKYEETSGQMIGDKENQWMHILVSL